MMKLTTINSITILTLQIVCLILCKSIQATTDYCNEKLCRNGIKHIACNNDGKISLKCSKNAELIDLNEHKDLITDAHNSYRNRIAGGQIKGYDPAIKMATMTWSDELAYLAELNVKTCEFKHDQCHNTDEFEHSGQNLGYWSGYPAIESKDVITKSIKDWFKEYSYANMNIIKSFQPSTNPKKIYGHFTAMIRDTNTKVGCGCLRINENRYETIVKKDIEITTYLFACNYATTNIIDHMIYKNGKIPASNCNEGKNPKYKFLCSVYETYNPNVVE